MANSTVGIALVGNEDPAFARLYYERAAELMEPPDPDRYEEILFPNWELIDGLLLEPGGEQALEEPVELETYLTNELVDGMNDWDRAEIEQ